MTAPKKVKPAKRERSTSTKGHYVDNKDLLAAFLEAREKGVLTDRLAKYLMLIAERYSYHPWFASFSWREDMVATAVLNLCSNWHKFDPTKSDSPNPFSYYSTAVYRSFLSYLDTERGERKVKDLLLIAAGANPSFNFDGGMSSDDSAFSSRSDE
jgi:hypothetical protein